MARTQLTRFNDFIFNNFNLPVDWQPSIIHPYCEKKFNGFESLHKDSFFTEYQVKKCILAGFRVAKSKNLTVLYKDSILLRDAYSEKGFTNTSFFFKRIRKSWIKSLEVKKPYSAIELEAILAFDELVKSFMPMCSSYITAQEAGLFVLSCGSILGAVYNEDIYKDAITTASKMTLRLSDYSPKNIIESRKAFLDILSNFVSLPLVDCVISRKKLQDKISKSFSIDLSLTKDAQIVDSENVLFQAINQSKVI